MPPSRGECLAPALMVRKPGADGVFRSQPKDLCEVVARPVDPALDCADGDVLTGGYLFIAHALRTDHQKDLALPHRQL